MNLNPADLVLNPVKLFVLALSVVGAFLCIWVVLFAAVVWGTINQLPFGQAAAIKWVWGELNAPPCVPIELPAAGVITATFGDPVYQAMFGREHTGIDIAVPVGTPVVATSDGVVTFAGWNEDGYGNLIVVENGDYSYYLGHLSQINVQVGDSVLKGETMGASGDTGHTTGPHIHYEVRYRGVPVELMAGGSGDEVYIGGEDECRPIVPPPPFRWPGSELAIIGTGEYQVTHAELWPFERAPGFHGRVLGFVRDVSGQPVSGVGVEVHWDGGSMRTITAGNGWYEFILGPGQYNVRVVDSSSQSVAFDTVNCDMPGHCVNQVDFQREGSGSGQEGLQ
ncbi:MAG: peptidoglycan DD-metalloendopeptidase family protein [Ardenticatenia bacterium]|nr:peptidoglycan DD-metalloendopeptidase family protein [Ardenticatenia bacterium]